MLGGTDVDVILPDGTFPNTTQSEAMSWAHGSTVVVNYNDIRVLTCLSGISYSTDGGVTFQHSANNLCTGHGTNNGDPVVVYDQALSAWYAGDLVSACGGLGTGLWTSPDGITWTPGACAHNSSRDDRESMWVDNNTASPHYGRMYISYNNQAIGGSLQVTYSDDGATWSSPVTLDFAFLFDVQVTGDLQGSGNVYVAGMDLGAGGLSTRTNYMFRSTDGGATWSGSAMGPAFQSPGRAESSIFALAFSTTWREFGIGQPAAAGNDVYYDWAQCGQDVACSDAADHGDIYFQRSTDSGATWSSPLKLNTDTGTAMQWAPSLAATTSGALYAGWYDEREANGGGDLDCTVGDPTKPCYRRWGRISLDGGATWQADEAVGDVVSPLPVGLQQNPLYQGDYDYITSDGDTIYDHWTDGRVAINNTAQQDVFLDRITAQAFTPTPTVTGTLPTSTPTQLPSMTPTSALPTSTQTPAPATATGTSTATASATATTSATARATAASTATVTPTACTLAFSDVPPGSTFYPYIHCLACLGIINGYPDGSFKPNNNVTRGQLSKIVANSAGFNDPQTIQTFQDVPVGSTFFQYIGRLASRGSIGGYPCGGPGEPCGPGDLPYFRPNNNATRGQISKIVSNAAGFSDTPSGRQFEDVAPGSTFYTYTYRLVTRNVMQGYQCGGEGEPCIPPASLPYFRPDNNATRGQTSKIDANTFFPDCQTP
jgi:hypothetical protein